MDDRSLIARASRRLGFGVVGGTLESEVTAGVAAFRTKLLTPDTGGVPQAPPLWTTDATVLPDEPNTRRKEVTFAAMSEWLEHMVTSPRTHTEWLTWFWHGHFVVAQPEVRNPQFMVDNLLLLRALGAGDFATLATEVTKDPAMLLYLDGNDNQAEAPNENFSRELLELFTLGIGNYTEDDVDSGASALTGWKIDRNTRTTRLFSDRHDGEEQPYLGANVDDLDGVVKAVMAQPAFAPFIAGRFARQVLGPNPAADLVAAAATAFTSSGYQVSALIGSLADSLLAGTDSAPLILGPVPWYIAARRATGSPVGKDVRGMLNSCGQLPWFCPSVAGWPYHDGWATAATHVGRFNLAAVVAEQTATDSAALTAVGADDNTALAMALGLPTDFSEPSWAAITTMPDARGRLTLALVSPEFVKA